MICRYVLSVCQYVIDDLHKQKIPFVYITDSVVCNDYRDLRYNCSCKSERFHGFGEFYCHKHVELLSEFFSFNVCRNSTSVCSNRSTAYDDCFDYYNFFLFTRCNQDLQTGFMRDKW